MKRRIPLVKPSLEGHELAYVRECLESGWISSAGPFVRRFETMMIQKTTVANAVALASGTAALHLALIVAGIRADEEVLLPALTFIAPANAVRYVGAHPVFIDVDREFGQLDPSNVASFIRSECRSRNGIVVNRRSGRRVRAILAVHLLGHPARAEELATLAREHDLRFIEDASQSLGARWRDRPVGSFGDVSTYSFNGNKLVTSGGGGMLVTPHFRWAERARYLASQARAGLAESRHGEIGYNYTLSALQAAVGCAQLERIESIIEKKRALARVYRKVISARPDLRLVGEAENAFGTFWAMIVFSSKRAAPEWVKFLSTNGVASRRLWAPLHRSPAHRGAQSYQVKVADYLYRQAFELPSFFGLSERTARAIGHLVLDGPGEATTSSARTRDKSSSRAASYSSERP